MVKKRKIKVEVEKIEEVQDQIPFTTFFHNALDRGLVFAWQEKEIHAFFRDIGLQDKEPTDKYKIALAKF